MKNKVIHSSDSTHITSQSDVVLPVDDEMAQVTARSHGNRSHTIAIRKSENRLLKLASTGKQVDIF